MKILMFIFLILGFIFVSFSLLKKENPDKPNQIVGNLLRQVNDLLKKKYKMKAIATSIASPGGIVDLLGLDFQIRGPLTKMQIRQILIDCAQQFVCMINASEEIRPHLHHYPFTIKDVQFHLFLEDEKGYELWEPYIDIAGITDGILSFQTLIQVNNIPKINTNVRETYEEALKAIEKGEPNSLIHP